MQHPYTQALFAALPEVSRRGMALTTIPGQVPALSAMPAGAQSAYPDKPLRMIVPFAPVSDLTKLTTPASDGVPRPG